MYQKMNTISFIVPVYNVENYIRRCLLSIISQIDTLPGSEIIIVNDGTKDKSMSIVNDLTYGKPFIRVLNQANGGLSKARNTGLASAICDYVWFIDSDDWLLDNALKDVKKVLSGKKKYDLLVSGLQWTYPDNSTCIDLISRQNYYANGIEYLKAKNTKGATPRYIISRKILVDNDVKFLEGVIHEDAHFGHIMPLYAKGVYVLAQPVYAYRQREDSSIMHSITMRSAYDSIKIHKDLMNFADKRLKGEMKDWFIFDCRDIIMGLYQYIKPLFLTSEYNQFYDTNKEYIRLETRKCIRLCKEGSLSKYRLFLFCFYPRISIYITSFVSVILKIIKNGHFK